MAPPPAVAPTAVSRQPEEVVARDSEEDIFASEEDGQDLQSDDSTISGLFDNNVASAFAATKTIKSSCGLEKCLLGAGLEVRSTHSDLLGRIRGPDCREARNGSKTSKASGRSEDAVMTPSSQDRRSFSKASAASAVSIASAESGGGQCSYGEGALIRRFFLGGSDAPGWLMIDQQHTSMDRLVRHLFITDDDLARRSSVGNQPIGNRVWDEIQASVPWPQACLSVGERIRYRSRQIITNKFFAAFFIMLTMYALFGPNVVPLLIEGADCEPGFLVTNTVVFVLFALEFILLFCGSRNYPFSAAFGIDLVALLSIFGDTWYMRHCTEPITATDGAHLSRVVRSNRMSRLARLTRIAKVTKLVPRLLRVLRRKTRELARTVLTRKVWRAFILLDTKKEGRVSPFDLKVFYFTVLQANCTRMLRTERDELLKADTEIFNEAPECQEDEHAKNLRFEDFDRIFHSTGLGHALLAHYVEDIKHEQTVWSLTNRLSENAAVKVCILVLILLLALSLFEPQLEDRSADAGLAHLEAIARAERLSNETGSFICEHINAYFKRHDALYLFLAGRTYWDASGCNSTGVPQAELDPFRRIDSIAAEGDYTSAEVMLLCLPGPQDCSVEKTTSMALINQIEQVRHGHFLGFLTLLSMVALLLIFVFLVKAKIRKFTEMFVNPLRSLADDMVAMSSLEILNAEEDHGADTKKRSSGVACELTQLRTAFASMHSATRSWSMYVPPCVVQRLLNKELEATIGVASCKVTILFCDIDGFEDACRGLAPARVLALVSDTLGKIADAIQASEGTLLEFIGDEVLAVFNTPNVLKNHAEIAVATALEIHQVVGQLPRITLATGKKISIRCRVGINTAQVLAGNLGSKSRMKYGLLGDGVNLAARLKGLNSRYRTRTLISASVFSRSSARWLVTRPVDIVAVKGRRQSTTVYEVLGTRSTCSSDVQLAALKHQEGFRLYHQRCFSEAQSKFDMVPSLMRGADNREEASVLLARRCAYYLRHPPGPEWDGVERLAQKNWTDGPGEELGLRSSSSSSEDLWEGDAADSADTRSTGDTLRTIGEGADLPTQPLCMCGWWPTGGSPNWPSSLLWAPSGDAQHPGKRAPV